MWSSIIGLAFRPSFSPGLGGFGHSLGGFGYSLGGFYLSFYLGVGDCDD